LTSLIEVDTETAFDAVNLLEVINKISGNDAET